MMEATIDMPNPEPPDSREREESAVEAFEEMLSVLGRNAGTMIAHLNHRLGG